jgi:hypothetical protein
VDLVPGTSALSLLLAHCEIMVDRFVLMWVMGFVCVFSGDMIPGGISLSVHRSFG